MPWVSKPTLAYDMIRAILSTKGASMPINSPYLKEPRTPMAVSMLFCAQYQIGYQLSEDQ